MTVPGIRVGERGEYHWVSLGSSRTSMRSCVTACPRLVDGRYVTVTAYDSGPLQLSDTERVSGWVIEEQIGVSPKVSFPTTELPFAEWSEWWIYEEPTPMRRPGVFVNYGGFTLEPPTTEATAFQADQQTRFWGQLDQYQPVSVLAEGDLTIVVTRDLHAWRQVSDWIESAPEHPDLAQ